jgi:dipeptidyl aminopeptidase/acylaminoacyl peptidase
MRFTQHRRHLAGLAGAVVLALAGTAAAGVAERTPSAAGSGPPAISVAGWDPERGATTVWRGLAELRMTRELPGARRPALARSIGALAFVRPVSGGFEVWLTGTQNDTERRLARVAGTRPSSLAVSPDGRVLAFPSARGLETVTSLGVRRLLPTPAAWQGSTFDGLQFSPDGSLLAFSRTWRDARTGALRNELGVIRRDGRGARSLVANPRPVEGRYWPAFTPDGRRVAFTTAGGRLAVVPAAGGTVTALTAPAAGRGEWKDTDPVFSRDGAWVAFTR